MDDNTISIRPISIDDVMANDQILYNVNNLWNHDDIKYKPNDYTEKLKLCNTKNWIYLFHDRSTIHEIDLSIKDVKWLKEAFRIGQITAEFPKTYIDELEDLCFDSDNSNSNIFVPESKDGKGWFVRSEGVSLKGGKHGAGPYFNLKMIIESIVTCRSGHSCFDKDVTNIKLYLIPWKDIDYDKEFRIFVYNNQITAISAQHLYQVNEWLSNSSRDEILSIIDLILNHFNDNIRDKLTFIGSYSMDLALILKNNNEYIAYFIEPNSFGAEYASGSALFHWKIDEDIMYGKENLQLRYTSND